MFLSKINKKESGILLYGITPPKHQTSPEKIGEIANKTISRLQDLDIDALVVYDVQDESARTNEVRPFPFLSALDPFEFAIQYLSELNINKIIYRPAGEFSKEELSVWLGKLNENNFYPVFVGLPSRDVVIKTSLKEAYQLWKENNHNSVIGAVTIPERHSTLKDEDVRILDKMNSGVSFFISQCVFNVEFAKALIEDLKNTCTHSNQEIPTIIFTLTACGSDKTLQFMDWLGIHVPEQMKKEMLESENILAKSLDICISIADELINYCTEKSIPFGFNIESVAIRKEEIEASIFMVNKIADMLKAKGLRK